MEMRLKGVAWDEVIEVMTSKEGTVYLRVVTEAGRFYRSTSLDLSPEQAEELGRALIAEAEGLRENPERRS